MGADASSLKYHTIALSYLPSLPLLFFPQHVLPIQRRRLRPPAAIGPWYDEEKERKGG